MDVLIWIIIINLDFDYLIISYLRTMLRDMFSGNRSRKSERRLYNQQSLKNQVTLSYIRPYLVKSYAKDYDFYHRYYTIYSFSLIPQYIIFVVAYLLYENTVLSIIIAVLKIILFFILRFFKFPDGHDSIYLSKR